MTNPDTPNPDTLNEIIAEYLAQADSGDPPNAEEWMTRFPEFAKELHRFFEDKRQIDELAGTPEVQKTMTPHLPARTVPQPRANRFASDPSQSLIGEKISYFGDYELMEEIARGGMGVVYRARQVSLNRHVALKMILAGQLATEQDLRRFQTEAESAARLDHPGIVPIFEIGQHQGQHYYSMGLVNGRSLAERLADEPLPVKEAAEVVKQTAQAVAYAHLQNVIHRDLKPGNVLLDADGLPRVTDFGLARNISRDSSLTGTGQILGTPGYMSPEQARGDQKHIGPASDVYSLGAILYCSVTGRPPFQAATPLEIMAMVLERMPVPPRQLNPSVPRDLNTICLKCLEKDPQDRYASATELAEDLERFLNDEPIHARPVGALEKSRRWIWKHRKVAGLLMIAVLVTIGAIWGSVFGMRMYRQSRLGELSMTSSGPALRAELYHAGTNEPAFETITIPTHTPLSIPAGHYRLCVSAKNRVGHSLNVTVARKRSHQMHIELTDLQDWPSFELMQQQGSATFSVVPFAESADFVIVDRDRGVIRRRADGETVWRWLPEQGSEAKYEKLLKNYWSRSADHSTWDFVGEPAIGIGDINNDNETDIVIRSARSASLMAFSGADGAALWVYPRFELKDPITGDPSELHDVLVAQLNFAPYGICGAPVAVDVDQDGVNDVVTTINAKSYERSNGEGMEKVESKAWLVALSGRDGSVLWRLDLDPEWFRGPWSFRSSNLQTRSDGDWIGPLRRLQWPHQRPAVALVCGNAALTVDVMKGKLMAEPIQLKHPSLSHDFADCNGDGADDLVISIPLESGDIQVSGYSLIDQTQLFEREVRATMGNLYRSPEEYLEWPRIIDLNGDGNPELLTQNGSNFHFCSLELVDISSQDVIWNWQTRIQPSSHGGIGHRSDPIAVGPDVDGDGYLDLFVATLTSDSESDNQRTLAAAVSGQTGETLWSWLGPQAHACGPLKWWSSGPDGHPLLVVSNSIMETAATGEYQSYMLEASTGILLKTLNGAFDPQVVDLNRDGLQDLVWSSTHEKHQAVSVFASEGMAPDVWQVSSPTIATMQGALHDLDGDGFPELLASHGSPTAVSGKTGEIWWETSGPEYFQSWSHPGFHADDDGIADVLIVPRASRRDTKLLAVSGADGSFQWRTERLEKIERLLDARSFDSGETILIIAAGTRQTAGRDAENVYEVRCIANKTGKTNWQTTIFDRRDWPLLEAAFADVNADGTGDVLLATRQTPTRDRLTQPDARIEFQIRAINGLNGETLWSQQRKSMASQGSYFDFRVADIDNDGDDQVVWKYPIKIENKKGVDIQVLNGSNGQPQWSKQFSTPHATELHLIKNRDGSSSIGLNQIADADSFDDERVPQLAVFAADGTKEERDITFPDRGYIVGLRFLDSDSDGHDDCFALVYDQQTNDVSLRALGPAADKILWQRKTEHSYFKLLRQSPSESKIISLVVDWHVYGIDGPSGRLAWQCASPLTSFGWQRYFDQGGTPNYADPHVIDGLGQNPRILFEYDPGNGGGATVFCREAISVTGSPD